MSLAVPPAVSLRYGRASTPEQAVVGLTLKGLQDELEKKPSKKEADEAVENANVVALVEKVEQTYLKKARGLKYKEQEEIARRQIAAWSKPYKGLNEPVTSYIVSPRWEAIKNAHYSGTLGAGFGGLVGELLSNYAKILNGLHDNLPFVGGLVPGGGHIPDMGSAHHAVLPAAVGFSVVAGTGAAIGKYLSTQKENADYEALMKFHPEAPSKANLVFDDRVAKLRSDWDANKADNSLERRFLSWFAPQSALPGELLPNQEKGWVFPWNMASGVLAPLRGIPFIGGAFDPLHQTVQHAESGGRIGNPGFAWSALRQGIENAPAQVYGLLNAPLSGAVAAAREARRIGADIQEVRDTISPQGPTEAQIEAQEIEALRRQVERQKLERELQQNTQQSQNRPGQGRNRRNRD